MVHVAGRRVRGTQVHEVRDEPAYLPSVGVVWQREWAHCKVDVIGNNSILELGVHELLDDWVLSQTVRAHEVVEELNLDLALAFAFDPAGVSSVDRCAVRGDGGSSGRYGGCEKVFHINWFVLIQL